MQSGKAGTPVSAICQAYPDRVEVRGRDLSGELMGRVSFTDYFHLLVTGREATDDQRFFLDLLLVAIAEHGMMPTNVAARMTLAADPGSLQGAVAAGILGCGPVILGTSELCARLLEQAQARVLAGEAPAEVAREHGEAHPRVRRQGAGLRPSGAPPARPARRAHPRARGRPRRRAAPHVALAREFRDGRRRGLGQAADDERLHADRRGDARPGLPVRDGQGDSAAGPHGRAARAPGGGAGAPDRLRHGRGGRAGGRLRARGRNDARARDRDAAVGRAAWRSTTPPTASSSPTSTSARPSTAPSWPRRGSPRRAPPAASADIARLPLTEKAGAQGHHDAGQSRRRASLRRACRDRAHLLHERHDGHAQLHPADRERSRQLGDGLGAQLRAPPASRPASASSRPTTPGRSSRARRWPRSIASGCATSRSARATASA